MQKLTAQPFIVLTGKDASKTLRAAAAGVGVGKGGGSRLGKPPLGIGKQLGGGGGGGNKPKLGNVGGGVTPLMGDRKVEAMLGVRKPTLHK